MKGKVSFLLVLFLMTGCLTLTPNQKKQFVFDEPIKALKMTVDYDPAFFPSNNVCGKVTVQNYGTVDYKSVTMMFSFTDSFGTILATNTFCLTNGLVSGSAATIEPSLNNPLCRTWGFGGKTFRSCPASMNHGRVEINTELAVKKEAAVTNVPMTFEKISDPNSDAVKSPGFSLTENTLKEPEFWINAQPFDGKVTNGLFYIDHETEAYYRKYDSLMRYSAGFDSGGLDTFEIILPLISEFSEYVKGRLEDTFVSYRLMGLTHELIGTTTEVWQNGYGAKTEYLRQESKSTGVYFENTKKGANTSEFPCKLSSGLVRGAQGYNLYMPVTRKQAEQMGRDIKIRIYFTITDSANPRPYKEYPAPRKDSFLRTLYGTEYTLYKARLHGFEIRYDSVPEDYYVGVVPD